jgi:ABC-2 type transport system permease protein
MARREVSRIFRIWTQTLLPPVISTVLYFAVFWGFLWSRIGEINGVSYIVFIVPGLIMLGVITNAFSNVASVTYMAKFQRNIEEVLVAPVPAWAVVLGYASGWVVRGILIATIILLVTMAFVSLPFVHIWVIALSIILTTLAFAFMGLVTGFYSKNFDQVGLVPTFILTPLTYLGGVFYSADSLTGIWRTVSHLNPIYHIVDLFRYGFTGVASGSPWIGVTILVGTIALFWGWGYWIVSSGRGLKA